MASHELESLYGKIRQVRYMFYLYIRRKRARSRPLRERNKLLKFLEGKAVLRDMALGKNTREDLLAVAVTDSRAAEGLELVVD